MTRPFGFITAVAYALRAAWLHYRFARTPWRDDREINGIGLVVTTRVPTRGEMDDVGCRWSDLSRMQGRQPLDPHVMWADMKIMWAAYHRKGEKGA